MIKLEFTYEFFDDVDPRITDIIFDWINSFESHTWKHSKSPQDYIIKCIIDDGTSIDKNYEILVTQFKSNQYKIYTLYKNNNITTKILIGQTDSDIHYE